MVRGERIEEERAEALRHLGEPVTGKLRDWAEATSRGFLWKSTLKRRNIRTYRCSLCGAEWEHDRREEADIYQQELFSGELKHWQRVCCPSCERTLDVYEEWRGAGKLGYKMHFVEQWRKSAADPNVLVAVGALVTRYYPEPGDVIRDARIQVVSFIVYRYGRAGKRWVADAKGDFYPRTKVAMLYAGVDAAYVELDTESVSTAVRGTPFERVWTDELMFNPSGYSSSPVEKMSWLSHTPTAEYVLKMGFCKLVKDRFSLPFSPEAVNWRGKTIEEVFDLDRATVRELRRYGKRVGYDEIAVLKQLRREDIHWPVNRFMEAYDALHLSGYGLKGFADEVRRRGGLLRLELKYLLKQSKVQHQRLHDLVDFWRQCDRLDVPADDYRTRHPRNLAEQHTEFSARVKYVTECKWDEEIRKLTPGYAKTLGFTGCGLILRPAADTAEIIREGVKLRHCVGGYCASYAQGNTVIMLLRKAEAPDEPWHTVEMRKDGTVIQCRGYENRTVDEEAPLIEQFWAEYRAAKRGSNAA